MSHIFLPHDVYIEWWYVNGHVQDAAGNWYAFMECLFKANPKRSHLNIFQDLPLRDYYFAHGFVYDYRRAVVEWTINYFVVPDQVHFAMLPLTLGYHTLGRRRQGRLVVPNDHTLLLTTPRLQLDLAVTKPALQLSHHQKMK